MARSPFLLRGPHLLPTTLLTLLLNNLPLLSAQSTSNTTLNTGDLSKRGLLYISTPHPADNQIFISSSSPLTWYYNFASSPGLPSSSLAYVPMIHSLENLDGDISAIRALDSIEHVLVFNEPDGDTGSGGSAISPRDAARAFIEEIMPLREQEGWQISLPATTGSPRGLEWLADFNESCRDIADNDEGCVFDFVAAHWYGDFPGLASHLGALHELYPEQEIWLTEFAIAQVDEEETLAMMTQSLPYLDGLEYVVRYAWFGAFRTGDANEWTGEGVSLLDGDGRLTEAGAVYLGGEERGFEAGDEADGSESEGWRRGVDWWLLGGVALMSLSCILQ